MSHDTAPYRRVLQAAWNLRGLGLFLAGPIVGVLLVGLTFGLPVPLRVAAGALLLFDLAIGAALVKGEAARLSGRPQR